MDNVSHTVAGLLIAEAALQFRTARGAPPTPAFARAAFWISALANNLSDFDFVYSNITKPEPLGYLLHHRGHTHTVPVALGLAALMLGAWLLLGRRWRAQLGPGEWRWLAGLALVGSLVHIAMDFTNNYGVHPFWPLYDGWMYGDFVFIIEPLFLVTGIPALLFTLRSRVVRGLLALVLFVVIALAWLVPFVSTGSAAVVTCVALLSLWLGKVLAPARRIAATFAAAALVASTFFALSFRAQALAEAELASGARIEEIALSPAPANPLCWSLWRVSRTGSEYIAERGSVAVLPALYDVRHCPSDGSHPTAPLLARPHGSSGSLRIDAEFRAPLAELSAMAQSNCFAQAFLRYARVPFWAHAEQGKVLGDLRYDRSPEPEFAELVLPDSGECPRFVPSWLPPRRQLWNDAR